MTRISDIDRNYIEMAIYLPMVLTVLNRDSLVIKQSPFKLRQPYLNLIEETMMRVQKDLAEVKRYMKQHQLQVHQVKRDDTFTLFMFLNKGYEEKHNYFNPRIRNKVQELLDHYLWKQYKADPLQKGKEA